MPFLELLLASNGSFRVLENLEINQSIHVIPGREAWNGMGLVIENSLMQVASDPNVKWAIFSRG